MLQRVKKWLLADLYLTKIHILMLRLSVRQLSFWRLKFLHYL
jgi:hypothetical protein